MDSKTQYIRIDAPSEIVLNPDAIHHYFAGNLKIESLTLKLSSGFEKVIAKVVSGTIKDKQIFDYLLARFEKRTKVILTFNPANKFWSYPPPFFTPNN